MKIICPLYTKLTFLDFSHLHKLAPMVLSRLSYSETVMASQFCCCAQGPQIMHILCTMTICGSYFASRFQLRVYQNQCIFFILQLDLTIWEVRRAATQGICGLCATKVVHKLIIIAPSCLWSHHARRHYVLKSLNVLRLCMRYSTRIYRLVCYSWSHMKDILNTTVVSSYVRCWWYKNTSVLTNLYSHLHVIIQEKCNFNLCVRIGEIV